MLASALVPAAAAAQAPGPFNPANRGNAANVNGRSLEEARKTLRQFGSCVVKVAGRRNLTHFIELPLDDPEYGRVSVAVTPSACLREGQLQIPRPTLRGAIFEALYLNAFAAGPPATIKASGWAGLRARNPGQLSPHSQGALALEQFGTCIGRTAPEKVHALLITEPASPKEDQALAALGPMFPACVPQGQTITFYRSVVRGALAEGLYWLSSQANNAAS